MECRLRRVWTAALPLFLSVLAFSGFAAAQGQPAPPPAAESPTAKDVNQPEAPEPARRAPKAGDVQKVFVVHYIGAKAAAEILGAFPATIRFSGYGPQLEKAIAVSAPPTVMAAIEAAIRRLDAPGDLKNVELTGYVLEALAEPAEGATVPPQLEPVIAQMKRTLNYAGYRAIDTLIARGREGDWMDASSTATLRAAGREVDAGSARTSSEETTRLSLRALPHVVEGEGGTVIRLDGMRFLIDRPNGQMGASSNLDIREGQQVVVGKPGIGSGRTFVLVLSAKVVN